MVRFMEGPRCYRAVNGMLVLHRPQVCVGQGCALQRRGAEEKRGTRYMEGLRCNRAVTGMPVLLRLQLCVAAERVLQRRSAGGERGAPVRWKAHAVTGR